jgi:hypothetical protein
MIYSFQISNYSFDLFLEKQTKNNNKTKVCVREEGWPGKTFHKTSFVIMSILRQNPTLWKQPWKLPALETGEDA